MRDKVGVAFIGAGTVAEMHGRGISAVPNASLVGAYDIAPERAEATYTPSASGRTRSWHGGSEWERASGTTCPERDAVARSSWSACAPCE